MIRVGLWVRLRAKPGKEDAVAELLASAVELVADERDTPLWFAVRFDTSNFAIFDVFEDDAGRRAHLGGRLASTLMERAAELFEQAPAIERLDVVAAKVP